MNKPIIKTFTIPKKIKYLLMKLLTNIPKTQITKTQQFFNMFLDKEVDINFIQAVLPENFPTDNFILKQEIVKFVNYRTEKNEN